MSGTKELPLHMMHIQLIRLDGLHELSIKLLPKHQEQGEVSQSFDIL